MSEETNLDSKHQRLGPGNALAIFFAYLAAQVAGGLSFGFLISAQTNNLALAAAAVGVAFGGIVVFVITNRLLVGASLAAKMSILGWKPASFRTCFKAAALGVLVPVVVGPLVYFVFPISDGAALGPAAEMVSGSRTALLIYALIAVFFAPPIEEFLFRGVILTGFLRKWGAKTAALLSTALFALAHLPEAIGYPPAILVIATMGIIAATLRLRTGSLLPAIVMHTAYNLSVVVVLLASPI